MARKWDRGPALTPCEAFREIEQGRPVYFNHKWTHPGWARGWQINMLIASALAGRIYQAVKIEEVEQ